MEINKKSEKIGLVLEGSGVRGIYTAGVLDVFMEQGISFDGVIGVSAGAIHGCSYLSNQKGRSIRYYKKYCADPRFMGLRSWLAKLVYRNYPAFAKALLRRHLVYNRTVEQILKLEQEGSIFVIRPEQPLNIGRLEKNPENVQRVYDIGYADGKKYVERLQAWMSEEK